MSAQEKSEAVPPPRRSTWLRNAFWVVAGGDVLLLLFWALTVIDRPSGQFDGLVIVALLGIVGGIGVMMAIVALIRHPVAYGIGLVLALWPAVYFGGLAVQNAVETVIRTPMPAALKAGHGYFDAAAERALADAIVVGDATKVAALAPAADLNAIGWEGMTFMRLALQQEPVQPAVVAALLRAGADPDQSDGALFGFTWPSSLAYGAMIQQRNEPLLRAVLDTGIDLNQRDRDGRPRFFSGLKWPEGLALMLDHGANTETEDKDGYTAMLWTIYWGYWRSIPVLLAHGARLDHVASDGTNVRSLVAGIRARDQIATPPEIADLETRLH